jgi:hypothetical protein
METHTTTQGATARVLPGGDDPLIAAAAATAARAEGAARVGPSEPAVDGPGPDGPGPDGPGPDEHATDLVPVEADPDDDRDFLARVQELLVYITELLDVVDVADERVEDDFEEHRRQIEAEAAEALALADKLEAHLLTEADKARRIAAQKARLEEFERVLAAPLAKGAAVGPSSPSALLDALDVELKAAKGILGAQRIGDLAALFVRGADLVHRLRTQAEAGRDRQVADAARSRQDAEASQQNRLRRGLALVHHDLRLFCAELPPSCAPWDDERWHDWLAPDKPSRWLRYGTLRRPEFGDVAFPAVLRFPGPRGLSIEGGARRDQAVAAVQGIVLRLLAAMPPGQARFTFIDATTLGEAATPFLALGRFRSELVDGGVHTVPDAIDAALTDVTRHIEQVVHQHLRGRYSTLDEANRETDDPVPYRFVVVLDHPNGLSDQALKMLSVIAETGPRCGVHPIVVTAAGPGAWGAKLTGLDTVRADHEGFYLDVERAGRWRLELDAPPPLTLRSAEGVEGLFTRIVTAVGEGARRARSSQAAPATVCAAWSEEALLRLRPDRPDLQAAIGLDDPATWWTAPADRGAGGPVGADGAAAPVGVWFDADESPGLLVVGDDRAVVSEAVSAAVHGLVLAHGPDALALWLVGLRGRRSLRAYADAALPHARLVAVDVDPRVGLAALEAAETELDRRTLMLAALGVTDDALAEYRSRVGEPLERTVVVLDGIEHLVGGQGEQARRAAEIVERLTAAGPAVGIHLLAGLGAGVLDARRSRWLSTMLPTMVEVTDLVATPGGPSLEPDLVQPMRVAGSARARRLQQMRRRADTAGDRRRPQIVLGDEPARLTEPAVSALAAGGARRRERRMPRLLLGESASLVGPCEITLQRAPAQHVVVGGGDEVARAGVAMAAVVSTVACHGDGAEVRVVDLCAPDVGFGEAIDGLGELAPVSLWRGAAVAEAVRGARREAEKRQATRCYGDGPLLVVVNGADRLAADLAADLAVVARAGGEVGVHLVVTTADVTADVVTGLLGSVDHRVVLGGLPAATRAVADALGAGDTAAATRSPWAVALDHTRARLEGFRPYGLPSVEAVARLGALAWRDTGDTGDTGEPVGPDPVGLTA